MDIVKRLRKWIPEENTYELLSDAADEIERLREDKAELVEALIDMRNHINKRDWDEDVSNEAKATFAKATGERVMDIVERLRDQFDVYDETKLEAANEIERLREVIENMTNLSNNLWHIGFTALKGDE
jgi:DNA repair exonuclease SbcCD ATPase subunit